MVNRLKAAAKALFSRPKTPPWFIVELEKGLPLSKDDDAMIASLREHPGMLALLNRMRYKAAVLESRLKYTRHSELRDVDILQLGITWYRILESEIHTAIGSVKTKKAPILAVDEVVEFEKARLAIESVGITSLE